MNPKSGSLSDWKVSLIPSTDTYSLRQRVLRPNLTIDEVAMDHDDAPDSFHVGAVDEHERVIAIMTVMRDFVPETDRHAWRIRGMASDPDVRGSGCGGAVLRFGLEHAWDLNQELPVWCNARRVAYGFYERYGFRFASDEFDIPGIGPHKVMIIDPA
ncbi:MAG: GNAT family N-acetyltransferase [Phycisphaerales bacterium]|nr:GNAT family N-acetyltransferase [Phycisphaerales bacterium]